MSFVKFLIGTLAILVIISLFGVAFLDLSSIFSPVSR